MLKEPLLVGLGAALGALARYAIFLAVPTSTMASTFGVTLAINIAACLAMGVFAPGKFWGMGFLGGFATLSAVTLASAQSSAIVALIFLASSFLACVGAWLIGDELRRRGGRPA